MDSKVIKQKLEDLNDWIDIAGNALVTFYSKQHGAFIRDTMKIQQGQELSTGTTTCRSFIALVDYYRFLREEKKHDPVIYLKVVEVLKGVSSQFLGALETEPSAVQSRSSNETNMFTNSHIMLSAALLPYIADIVDSNLPTENIIDNCKIIAKTDLKTLRKKLGGIVHETDEVHDFITLHSIRAIDALKLKVNGDKIGNRARDYVLRMLGYYQSKISYRFDPSELVFSAAVMSRFPSTESNYLEEAALEAVAACQSADGSWPTARIISSSGRRLLHVASYEVALTITNLFLKQILDNNQKETTKILHILDNVFKLAKSSYTKIGVYSGWSNDHTRVEGLVEAWATAIVLTFFIHYRDTLIKILHNKIISKYNVEKPKLSNNGFFWTDLEPLLQNSSKVRKNWDSRLSDPTDQATLSSALKNNFIEPILMDRIRKPGEKRSLILFGKPGSRKTTLVRIIGEALGWPVLILSPPDFLSQNGLEGFEASAQEIFDDLMQLRRTVILFDECEDFFKRRGKKQLVEARTIGAFITAGMLPRLQALRDYGWVIFVFATNSMLKELDPAVIREGRFDFSMNMEYPTFKAQKRYIQKKIGAGKVHLKKLDIIINELEKYNLKLDKDLSMLEREDESNSKGEKESTDNWEVRKTRITFSILDQLIEENKTKKVDSKNDKADFIEGIRNFLDSATYIYPPSLV